MSALTANRTVTGGVFGLRVTATDGFEHQVDEVAAAAAATGRAELLSLCCTPITEAPRTAQGQPCPWCHAVVDHLELADPMHLGGNRVARFVAELKQARSAA